MTTNCRLVHEQGCLFDKLLKRVMKILLILDATDTAPVELEIVVHKGAAATLV